VQESSPKRAPGIGRWIEAEAEAWDASCQMLQHDPDLEAGQGGPEAIVDTFAEADMFPGVGPPHIEPLRIIEPHGIAIGCPEEQEDLGACRNLNPAHLDGYGRDPPPRRVAAVVTNALLDRVGDEAGVLPKRLPLISMGEKLIERVGGQAGQVLSNCRLAVVVGDDDRSFDSRAMI